MRLTIFCLALVAATADAQERPRFTFRRDTALLAFFDRYLKTSRVSPAS
jgi:hypothetical protein